MDKRVEDLERRVHNLEKQVAAITTTIKQKCCNCANVTFTNLQLENGEFICESCAQIMGELASF